MVDEFAVAPGQLGQRAGLSAQVSDIEEMALTLTNHLPPPHYDETLLQNPKSKI